MLFLFVFLLFLNCITFEMPVRHYPYGGGKELVQQESGLEVKMCGDGMRAWRPPREVGLEQIWAIVRG